MSYYDRQPATHLDGSPIFKTAADEAHEGEVAKLIEVAWRCHLSSFGRLAPIDWWAERDGRIVGVLELKSREHPAGQYPTVFLNLRKWLALRLAAMGFGVPAVFVVRFSDRVMYTTELAGELRIGGTNGIVKSRNDVEPVVEIPIASMHDLRTPA